MLYTSVLSDTGALYVWGNNAQGQLGDNSTVSRSSPVQITAITTKSDQDAYLAIVGGTAGSWSQISIGDSHVLALRSDSSLWTWGLNASGQLSDGTIATKPFPIKIGTSSWSLVSAGGSFGLALRTDGAIITWGGNTQGQLGDGTVVHRSNPIQIGTSSWSQISSGTNQALAIRIDGSLWAWGLNTNGQLGDGTTINSTFNQNQSVQQTPKNTYKYINTLIAGGNFTIKK